VPGEDVRFPRASRRMAVFYLSLHRVSPEGGCDSLGNYSDRNTNNVSTIALADGARPLYRINFNYNPRKLADQPTINLIGDSQMAAEKVDEDGGHAKRQP
jgi:hypothetical protein